MRDIPVSIIRKRRDSLIVLKEKKSKITLLNPQKKLYHEVKIDGDCILLLKPKKKDAIILK